MKIDILGVKIDNLTMEQVLKRIKGFLKNGKQHYIVVSYSEVIVRAQKNKEFKDIFNKADLCLCESRGLWIISRFLGKKIKKNIYGVDLIFNLNQRLFLLGGKRGVAERAGKKLDAKIVGTAHGYQDLDKVIEKINKTKPDILLVGLGSPKQEKWIYENLKKMPSVKLAIGVGGAFDFISGKIKRAPKFIQKIGLEWLWRLVLQPRRIKRILKGVLGLAFLTIKNMLLLKKR